MDWTEFVKAAVPEPYTVSVEQLLGAGGRGDLFGPPAEYGPCVVEATTRTVSVQTSDAQGTNRLSSTTVYGPPTPVVATGSRVTLPDTGRTALVLAVSRLDDHGLGLPSHQELSLE